MLVTYEQPVLVNVGGIGLVEALMELVVMLNAYDVVILTRPHFNARRLSTACKSRRINWLFHVNGIISPPLSCRVEVDTHRKAAYVSA